MMSEGDKQIQEWARKQHWYWHGTLPNAEEEDVLCTAMAVSLVIGVQLADMSQEQVQGIINLLSLFQQRTEQRVSQQMGDQFRSLSPDTLAEFHTAVKILRG